MRERGEEEKALQNFFSLIVYTSFRQNALLINFFCVSLLYQNWKFTEFSTFGFVIYSKKVPGQTIKGPCL